MSTLHGQSFEELLLQVYSEMKLKELIKFLYKAEITAFRDLPALPEIQRAIILF
jgi:hypothetical protein